MSRSGNNTSVDMSQASVSLPEGFLPYLNGEINAILALPPGDRQAKRNMILKSLSKADIRRLLEQYTLSAAASSPFDELPAPVWRCRHAACSK